MTSGIREWLAALAMSHYAAAFEATGLAHQGSVPDGPSSIASAVPPYAIGTVAMFWVIERAGVA